MCELSETVERKFIDSIELDDCWEIETDTGWSPISHIHKTIEYQEYLLTTESGKQLICADTHIIFDENMSQIFTKDCIPGKTKIVTRDGIELVASLIKTENCSNMYDLSVSDDNHRFWSGEILSHNSTILDALTYVLYGKPFRKINKPQLINSTNNSNLLVEIEIDIDKNTYKIKRGMKPNIFEIYENGKLLNQDSLNKDYQEFLETMILKMNYKTFTQIVVIGNATYMPFMKLNPFDRRIIVENLLDIDLFSKMNILLKTLLSETKENLLDNSYKLDLLKEKIKIHNNLISDSSNNVNIQIEDNKKEIARNLIQKEAKEKNIKDLLEEIESIKTSDISLQSIKSKQKKLVDYRAKFNEKTKSLSKEIKFFSSNNSCPTCTQPIGESFRKDVLDIKNSELVKFSNALKVCNDDIDAILQKIKDIEESVDNINSTNTKIYQIQFEIDSLSSYITKLEKTNAALLKKRESELSQIREEYDNLLVENETLSIKREDIINSQHIQSIAAVLLKDDGIKTKIIKHYLPIMNKIINKYLQIMDFYSNFSLDENFNEVIKNKSKENFSYHSFSEGEKLRIDLAILFTWRELSKNKNAANTNLLILDEILDSSLDASGTDEFLKILTTNNEKMNTFVISHKTELLADKFDRVYTFSKLNGFTKISVTENNN
jgi:DNA repair exonuclease SbcCD ATPase subunit